MKHSLISTLFLLIAASFLSACTNTQVANSSLIEQQALSEATKSQITPEQAINEAAESYSQALEDELMFFAPLHMDRAKNKLDDAQDMKQKIQTKEDKVATIGAAFEVKTLISKAYKNKDIVSKQLVKVLDHKKVLLELESDRIQAKDYRKAIDKLSNLIKEIEGGFLTKAANDEPKVLAFFAEVEADTLRTLYLAEAIKMLDKADSVDADEFAAITYEKAEVAIEYADDFIEKHYRDREGVKSTSTAALNSAAHAYHVSLESQKILELDEEGAERRILYIEKLIQRINTETKVDNLKSMSLKDKVEAITDAIASKNNNNIANKKDAINNDQGDSELMTPKKITNTPSIETPAAEKLPGKTDTLENSAEKPEISTNDKIKTEVSDNKEE